MLLHRLLVPHAAGTDFELSYGQLLAGMERWFVLPCLQRACYSFAVLLLITTLQPCDLQARLPFCSYYCAIHTLRWQARM